MNGGDNAPGETIFAPSKTTPRIDHRRLIVEWLTF